LFEVLYDKVLGFLTPGTVQSLESKMEEVRIPLDDGHRPGATTVETTAVAYQNKNSTKFVNVYDNVLNDLWQGRIYDYGVERGRPWGVYVTTKMVDDLSIDLEAMWLEQPQMALAIVSARELVFGKAAAAIGKDKEKIDGTVVWCLVSQSLNTVEYHIDYAELYRYETNVIYPPIYGGVYHASPFAVNDMVGGDFVVNMQGLDHYRRFGYKGALRTAAELEADVRDGDWMCVRYKGNRGMVFDGELPHAATPIVSMPKRANASDTQQQVAADSVTVSASAPSSGGKYGGGAAAPVDPNSMRRVILGFNCFPASISECCARAPEHSEAFNRTVKLYQAMRAAGTPVSASAGDGPGTGAVTAGSDASTGIPVPPGTKKKKGGGITLQDLKKNPALTKLLVAAAKQMKAKEAAKAQG